MKAVVLEQFGGPEMLRPADIDLPEPGPGQVWGAGSQDSQPRDEKKLKIMSRDDRNAAHPDAKRNP
jgi:hypothetical protein